MNHSQSEGHWQIMTYSGFKSSLLSIDLLSFACFMHCVTRDTVPDVDYAMALFFFFFFFFLINIGESICKKHISVAAGTGVAFL